MKALLQRVTSAQVRVNDALIGSCSTGLMILVCAMREDTEDMPARLAAKISKLRIFHDDAGKMNRSILDIGGSALVISQFTLAADTSRGNRPGFSDAAAPNIAKRLYQAFVVELQSLGIPTQTGQFGADMAVSLTNDGPVTIAIEV